MKTRTLVIIITLQNHRIYLFSYFIIVYVNVQAWLNMRLRSNRKLTSLKRKDESKISLFFCLNRHFFFSNSEHVFIELRLEFIFYFVYKFKKNIRNIVVI